MIPHFIFFLKPQPATRKSSGSLAPVSTKESRSDRKSGKFTVSPRPKKDDRKEEKSSDTKEENEQSSRKKDEGKSESASEKKRKHSRASTSGTARVRQVRPSLNFVSLDY